MKKFVEELFTELKKYENRIVTVTGLITAISGMAGLSLKLFHSKLYLTLTFIGLFLLLRMICATIANAKKISFGVLIEAYTRPTRRLAKYIGIASYLLLAYPLFITASIFIPQKKDCDNTKQFGLIISRFSTEKEDDFSYILFNKLEAELQPGDSINLTRSDKFVQSGLPHYMDTAKEIFSDNCTNHGLLVFGMRNGMSKLFDCNIFVKDLEKLRSQAENKSQNNIIYVENPDLLNFSIESQANVVTEFILGLLNYYNGNYSLSRDWIKHSLDLNKNTANKKFISLCYLFLGNNSLQEKKYWEAISSYKKGLTYDSTDAFLHFNLANSLLVIADTVTARSEFQLAANLIPRLKTTAAVLQLANLGPEPNKINSSLRPVLHTATKPSVTLKQSALHHDNLHPNNNNTQPGDLHLIINDNKYGLADTNGVTIIPCLYDSIYRNEFIYRGKSYILAMKNKKFGALNRQGGEEIPFNHPSAERVMTVIQVVVDSTPND